MKRRAFTVVEVLISCFILSFILLLSISIISLMNTTLWSSQIETQNRSNMSDNIFFITREIQSAEKIQLSEKTLKIKQFGSDGYNLVYTITAEPPYLTTGNINFGSLNFKDKKMLDLDFDRSRFELEGDSIRITLAVLKNNREFKQAPKVISFCVTMRSEGVEIIEN